MGIESFQTVEQTAEDPAAVIRERTKFETNGMLREAENAKELRESISKSCFTERAEKMMESFARPGYREASSRDAIEYNAKFNLLKAVGLSAFNQKIEAQISRFAVETNFSAVDQQKFLQVANAELATLQQDFDRLAGADGYIDLQEIEKSGITDSTLSLLAMQERAKDASLTAENVKDYFLHFAQTNAVNIGNIAGGEQSAMGQKIIAEFRESLNETTRVLVGGQSVSHEIFEEGLKLARNEMGRDSRAIFDAAIRNENGTENGALLGMLAEDAKGNPKAIAEYEAVLDRQRRGWRNNLDTSGTLMGEKGDLGSVILYILKDAIGLSALITIAAGKIPLAQAGFIGLIGEYLSPGLVSDKLLGRETKQGEVTEDPRKFEAMVAKFDPRTAEAAAKLDPEIFQTKKSKLDLVLQKASRDGGQLSSEQLADFAREKDGKKIQIPEIKIGTQQSSELFILLDECRKKGTPPLAYLKKYFPNLQNV